MLNYRLLTPDEWPKLKKLFGDNPLPNPVASVIAVAENDAGEIMGLLCLQIQWHMEPLIIPKGSKANFLRLKQVLDNQLPKDANACYYSFIVDDHMAVMAEHAGMKPEPFMVFKGEA
jgi:hypothetical protein